MVVIHGNRVIV